MHAPMKRTGMGEISVPSSERSAVAALPAVHSSTISASPLENIVPKPVPKPFDVLLGRSRGYASHAGNQRLQIFINMHLERYLVTQSRPEKTHITNEILYMVKTCGKQPGRFLKFEDEINGWVDVSDEVARLEISKAMRYAIRTPSEGIIPPSMLEFDDGRLGLMKDAPPSTTPESIVSRQPTNPEMRPPPPRLRISESVAERSDDVDYDCEVAEVDDRTLMSDEAILSSLGYAPPLHKKNRSKRNNSLATRSRLA